MKRIYSFHQGHLTIRYQSRVLVVGSSPVIRTIESDFSQQKSPLYRAFLHNKNLHAFLFQIENSLFHERFPQMSPLKFDATLTVFVVTNNTFLQMLQYLLMNFHQSRLFHFLNSNYISFSSLVTLRSRDCKGLRPRSALLFCRSRVRSSNKAFAYQWF